MNAETELFLRSLGGTSTFQTFDESGRKDRLLSRAVHGTLTEHADMLHELNARGAGAFVMVNEGDGKGRRTNNVRRVRAYFVDLDGALLAPVRSAPLPAHCIIESSPNRWHAYWLVRDAPLETFKAVQLAIAKRFSADTSVCDLPRVMRLPGFLHCKGVPFLTRVVEMRDAERYMHEQFTDAFEIPTKTAMQLRRPCAATVKHSSLPIQKRNLPTIILNGDRNVTLLSLAAGLVRQGFDLKAVNSRLHRINAERCETPLCASEVDTIAARAVAYGSEGYLRLPHTVFDSMQQQAMPLAARWIVATAFRRHNGHNNGSITLTWQDCKNIPGCADERAFYRYRRQAVASGFMTVANVGRLTRDGKTPTLYAIPQRYLSATQTGQSAPVALTGQHSGPYVDKQLSVLCSGSPVQT